MGGTVGGDVFDRIVAEGAKVDAIEQCFSLTEQERRYGKVHLIDMTCTDELSDGPDSAADLDVFPARGGPSTSMDRCAPDHTQPCWPTPT